MSDQRSSAERHANQLDGHTTWSDSQAHFLASAGDALASTLDYEQILARLCNLAVPALADWCSVAVAEADGTARRVAIVCADPALRPLADAIAACEFPTATPYAYARVIQTGEPELIETYPPDYFDHLDAPEDYRRLMRQLNPRATLSLPLLVRGFARGAISFTMAASQRTFTPELRALAAELARRAAVAVDHALLYRGAHRRLAELATVQRLAQAITSAVRLDRLCAAVVEQVSGAFGYRLVSVYLREHDELVLQAAVGYQQVLSHIGMGEGVSGRVVRTGLPSFVRDAAHDPDFLHAVGGIRQGIFVPLCYAGGPALGMIAVESTGEPLLTDDDLTLLCLLADQISVAVVNARLFSQVDAAASRFRSLMGSAGSVIFCLTPELRVSELNPEAERIYGRARDEAVGLDYLDHFVSPADRGTVLELVRAAVDGTHARPFETVIGAGEGRQRTILWAITSRADLAGAPAELLVIGHDITARREAEEARRSLERKMLEAQRLESLGVLAGGIAHDFNNLLAAILGNANLLLLDLPPGSEAYQSARQIELVTARAADLVGQMLAYAGRGRADSQPIDLNALVAEMIVLLRVSISKDAVLVQHLSPSLPPIKGDPSQIRQVVMNLIVNASEALGEAGGLITIATKLRDLDTAPLTEAFVGSDLTAQRYVSLTVADTGVGMDENTRARIFDPFFTTKLTGRGLGLAAVLGIVRSHHGALLVESAEGRGSTFTVLLPVIAHTTQAVSPLPLPLACNNATPVAEDPLVLVIDDEEDVRYALARILERGGYGVLSVGDGAGALELLRTCQQPVVAALVDLSMPGLSGDQLIRALRLESPNLPVILMSGYAAVEGSARLAAELATVFVQKPFRAATIHAILAQIRGGQS